MAEKRQVDKEYIFATTLTPGLTARMTVASEVTGRIRQITRHWPDGADALVDIAFGKEDMPLCPSTRGTYVALNDATPRVYLTTEVRRDDILWVEFRNRDAVEDHSPVVIVNLRGYEGPE